MKETSASPAAREVGDVSQAFYGRFLLRRGPRSSPFFFSALVQARPASWPGHNRLQTFFPVWLRSASYRPRFAAFSPSLALVYL